MSNPIYSTPNPSTVKRGSNGSLIIICIIVFCILFAALSVNLLNGNEMRKFEGTWENGDNTLIFMSNGELRSNEGLGSYSVEKGKVFIDYDGEGASSPTEFIYYFSSDGQTLELHWVVQDAFMTYIKIK